MDDYDNLIIIITKDITRHEIETREWISQQLGSLREKSSSCANCERRNGMAVS